MTRAATSSASCSAAESAPSIGVEGITDPARRCWTTCALQLVRDDAAIGLRRLERDDLSTRGTDRTDTAKTGAQLRPHRSEVLAESTLHLGAVRENAGCAEAIGEVMLMCRAGIGIEARRSE